jgi:uncharacterized spore protein YtfJ
MENNALLETIARGFGQNASIKNVYGEPITTHGRTIIPVAKIAMGLGGGQGIQKDRKQKIAQTTEKPEDNKKGEGSGAGGGMYATAKGVYEISDKGTRFIPADATKQLLTIAAIAFITGRWMGRRKRTRQEYKGHKA